MYNYKPGDIRLGYYGLSHTPNQSQGIQHTGQDTNSAKVGPNQVASTQLGMAANTPLSGLGQHLGSNQSLATTGNLSQLGSISSMGSSVGSNANSHMGSNSTFNTGFATTNYNSNPSTNAADSQSQYSFKSPNLPAANSNAPGANSFTLNPSINQGSNYYRDKRDNELEKYRLQLNLKSQIIINLNKKLDAVTSGQEPGDLDPKTNEKFYRLFQELSEKLDRKTAELNKVNEMFEGLLVSISMNAGDGGLHNIDEQELTHKIVNKINYLTLENENLLKLVSYSNKLSLLIELGLLKNEVKQLQLKLDKYDS